MRRPRPPREPVAGLLHSRCAQETRQSVPRYRRPPEGCGLGPYGPIPAAVACHWQTGDKLGDMAENRLKGPLRAFGRFLILRGFLAPAVGFEPTTN